MFITAPTPNSNHLASVLVVVSIVDGDDGRPSAIPSPQHPPAPRESSAPQLRHYYPPPCRFPVFSFKRTHVHPAPVSPRALWILPWLTYIPSAHDYNKPKSSDVQIHWTQTSPLISEKVPPEKPFSAQGMLTRMEFELTAPWTRCPAIVEPFRGEPAISWR
jgi:hypothetical protein